MRGKDWSALDDEELAELAREAQEGDMRPFEVLVDRNQGWVRANCRHITRGKDEEDLSQEVLIKVYFGLRRFQRRSSFKTWVSRIKANHCLNHLRKLRARPTISDSLDDVPEGRAAVESEAGTGLHADDERRRIAAVLDSMSDTLRVPLVLRDMDDMAYQEIADLLGVGLSAVKMRIKRAREDFRLRMEAT